MVKESRKRYEEVIKTLPPGMELIWVDEDARNVQASVDATIEDILSGILLCAAILFLFLVNIRATFVVALAMPVTIIISLFFMGLAGYTLNQSTLLAIGLSVGILVSNSIVVLRTSSNALMTYPTVGKRRIGTSEVAVAVLARPA